MVGNALDPAGLPGPFDCFVYMLSGRPVVFHIQNPGTPFSTAAPLYS